MAEVTYEAITYEVTERAAVITLNRPKQMNSWTFRMSRELKHALERAENDKQVFGVVITGNGRAFCAGADMQELNEMGRKGDIVEADDKLDALDANPGAIDLQGFDKGTHAYFATIAKPIIGAINGAAAGMGMSIVLRCDLRFFGESGYISSSFSKLGLPAEAGTSWILPKLVGFEAAFDILTSSRKVGAGEARQMGLASKVCSDATLVEEAVEYVNNMATTVSPESVAMIKDQLYRDLSQENGPAGVRAHQLMMGALKKPDFREGVKAFMEKRKPRYEGFGKD